MSSLGRSVYFGQNVASEKELYEDLIIESISIMGFNMFYLPRTVVSLDSLLNEDTESRFDNAFEIPMYIESIDGYDGDGILMSKFGLEIRNQLKVVVSKRRWNLMIGRWNRGYNNYRPSEGDLIYIPQVQGLFEVKFVDLETPFHQLQNLPVYRLTLELFEYRGEDMNTRIDAVDRIQDIKSKDSSFRVGITYSTGSSTFMIHEPVGLTWPSGTTGTARVTAFLPQSDSSLVIQLSALRFTDGQIHNLITGVTISGQESGAEAAVSRVVTLTSGDTALNDGDISIQNSPIESASLEILDFTETNPFGTPADSN